MDNAGLADLLQTLYHDGSQARAVLINIGYPPGALPPFESAAASWPVVLVDLDARVPGGRLKLLKAARTTYPGRGPQIDAFLEWLTVPVIEVAPEPFPVPVGGWGALHRPGPGSGPVRMAVGEPGPPSASDRDEPFGVVEGCPTLTLAGADLPEQFLAAVRELVGGEAELLYVTKEQSAVRIADPGDEGERVRRGVQEVMRELDARCRVSYRKYSFRPYLYLELVVYGPGGSGYTFESVPSTSTPEDIAARLVMETYEAGTIERGGIVKLVIDLERAGQTSRRLDPYATLHEGGIAEGDRFRVAPEATAGSISPELRVEAVLRAVAQIKAYARRDPARFVIVGCDDELLPGRIDMEIHCGGIAPDPGGEAPIRVPAHRVAVHFRAMFPLQAPDIVWNSEVFHPNVQAVAPGDLSAGTLLFHPLMLDYRPEADMKHLCEMVTNVAAYRDYDISAGSSSPNPAAAEWAATEDGQAMIRSIGGRPLADVRRDGGQAEPQSRPFWLRPLGEVPREHQA